jgi:hypothetical protein
LSLQRCEGNNLESVLEEVRNRFGDTVTIVEANRLRKGGLGGFFARERFEVVVDIDETVSSLSGLSEIPAEYGLEVTEDFRDRLLSLADGVDDVGEFHLPPPTHIGEFHLPPLTAAGPAISTEQPEFSALLASITRHMEAPEVPAAPQPLPAPVAPARPAVDHSALARLGLPEDITAAAAAAPAPPGADPSAWLLNLLGKVPAAERLPQAPGSVIVVSGSRDAALRLARQMATELGLDSDSLLLASPGYRGRAIAAHRRITGVDNAVEARSSWRRRPRPTIVAVDAPMGRTSDWARRIIDALEPTMVWGAVEATRKPDDVFEWSEALGGFDALGVTDLDGTVSPAAVLQCGIPVGRIDGQPATPLQWTARLAPRLGQS